MTLICETCQKVFETYRQLNGHKRIHNALEGKQPTRKRKLIDGECHHCSIAFTFKNGCSTGKYCSIGCTASAKRAQTVERIHAGEAGHQSVRKYLIEDDGKCVKCGVGSEWYGQPLSLHLDHINGDSDNNALSNVQLLCPNCHSQTCNYGIKNKGQSSRRNKLMARWRANGPMAQR